MHASWHELRYSLRSLQNLSGIRTVHIIGDPPEWIENTQVRWSVPMQPSSLSKFRDQNTKIFIAISDESVSDDFVLMHDDVLFTKKTDPDELNGWHLCDLTDTKTMTESKHRDLTIKTMELFKDSLNYETHMPYLYNKKKMLECFKLYNPIQNALQIATMYFNRFRGESRQCRGIITNHFGVDSMKSISSDDFQWILQNERKIMNYNDHGLTRELIQYIMQKFPKQSKFEKHADIDLPGNNDYYYRLGGSGCQNCN